MREIIQKVIASEAEGHQLIRAARAEAERLRAEARARADRLVEQAGSDVRVEAARLLAAGEEQAGREKAQRVSRAAEEINRTIGLDEVRTQQAVASALRCVLGSG